MTWNIVLEKNQHSHNRDFGFDKLPPVDAYFDIVDGKITIVTKVYWTGDTSNSNLLTFRVEPFEGIVFDFINFTYKISIYSYYYAGTTAPANEHTLATYKSVSTLVKEFNSPIDLQGVKIPTDIPMGSPSAFLKYHIVLSRTSRNIIKTKINNKVLDIIGGSVKINNELKKIEKAVMFKKTEFTIAPIIDIPFSVPQKPLTYQKYAEVLARFPTNTKEVFGRDASNTYDLTCIHIGTKGKPCIFINAGMHGGEWQGVQYSTSFVLDLLNNTFPDPTLRNNLINNYHMVFVPCLNPWGMNNFGGAYITTYYNANQVQLNGDFAEGEFTQPETKAFVSLVKKYTPFTCLDVHLMSPGYAPAGGHPLIIGNGHYEQDILKDVIANTMSQFSGDTVGRWEYSNAPTSGLLRAYVARQPNPSNIKTISYITEVEKPDYPLLNNDTGSGKYSNLQIFQLGYLFNYLFLKTSIMYLEHYKNAKKIEVYF